MPSPSSSSSSHPSSSTQTAAFFDALLGRRPAPAPAHLTRVLYLPFHDNNTNHLPVYEAGDSYRRAVGGSQLGSTLYALNLSAARRPRPDGTSHRVVYHGNMHCLAAPDDDKVTIISVEKRALGNQGGETRLTVLPLPNKELQTSSIESTRGSIQMDTFFPIPPSKRAGELIHHPYFRLDVPLVSKYMNHTDSTRELEWQVHPIEDGPLRYTLVDKDKSEDAGAGARTLAIYHDAGCSKTLWRGMSEGVILLPEEEESADDLERIVVVSLLGVLWQIRTLQGGTSVPPKRVGHMKQFRRLFARFCS
ncbi:hypothetical protein PG999_012955 [Apiospora kogelbergensis]|uniref:DUF3074 domain-containing protein n=1 Tax=Apiospora kogelbergensis TaxID=1337665 RepID=A0AAW0QCI2_9PEZI